MGKDSEKGAGRWISGGSGGGNDPDREPIDFDEMDATRSRQVPLKARQQHAAVARVLRNAVTTYLVHGEQLDDADRKALTEHIERDLGGKLGSNARQALREFVDTAVDGSANGDKAIGWNASTEAASQIADEWKPASRFEIEEDTRSVDEIIDEVPR